MITDPVGTPAECSYWAEFKNGKVTYWVNPKYSHIEPRLKESFLELERGTTGGSERGDGGLPDPSGGGKR
jgi:hypothetical protein